MLLPSKKLFYAVEAVLFIAYNAKAGPIAGRDIAEKQNLPARYLEPMMQKLVRAGILRGVRGPQGGYVLARERRRISLADICNALADDAVLPDDTTPLGDRVLKPQLRSLTLQWQQQLSAISIAQLCEEATEQNIALAYTTIHDFAI
ncbi:MAG: transcriptional regulator [Azospirillum brasilense]|nr:MAG: transcriptional regulator [Azospirillum brasilense]